MFFFAEIRLQQIRILFGDHGRESQILRMVGNHEKIQRALQTGANASAGGDHIPAREAVGLLRGKPVADHARIRGIRGVQVRIAPENALGITDI
jgi:hypothetical protein